jgi:LysR family transcriptional regulator, regulator of abg operon
MKHIALQALVAAIEEGSLRKAANRLLISQPAITKTIRELEKDVGATLLQRTSIGVSPSPQGQRLYERAKKVLRELSAARAEIDQLSGRMRGELSIGAAPLAVMLLIPETIRTYSKACPQVSLRISEELYFEQLERLRRGDVQVAIGGVPQGLAPGEFVIEPLINTRMVVVVNNKHKQRNAKSLKELAELPWVYTGTSKEEGYARTLFQQHDLAPPHVGAIVNSTLTLLSLVATGQFVGLMPEQIANQSIAREFISIVPIQEAALPLKVAAMVRNDVAVTPSVKQFINHLHRAAHHINQTSHY